MDEETRKAVENEIEKAREGLSSVKDMLLNSSFSNIWNLKNKHDFAMGWAIGGIQGGFLLHSDQYPPLKEDEMEMIVMLKNKLKKMEKFYNAI